jgi:hypothetical protein
MIIKNTELNGHIRIPIQFNGKITKTDSKLADNGGQDTDIVDDSIQVSNYFGIVV